MQAPLSSKTSGGACIFTEGPESREMLLKDRISPIRNTYLANSLPFLPGLLTPILSVRSVVLLGRLQGGALQERVAGSLRPSKTLQGSAPHPTTLRIKVRSVCRAAQPPLLGRRRNVCTLPLSIFCLTWFIGFWFMTAEHVLLTYSRSGCKPKLKQTQRSRHFVTHWYDNEWVKGGHTYRSSYLSLWFLLIYIRSGVWPFFTVCIVLFRSPPKPERICGFMPLCSDFQEI